MNIVEAQFKKMMRFLNHLCDNNEICVFFIIALFGFLVSRFIDSEGMADFPAVFDKDPSPPKKGVKKTDPSVVGQTPEPVTGASGGRVDAPPSLRNEVSALGPLVVTVPTDTQSVDGSLKVIQGAPLAAGIGEENPETWAKWSMQAQPTGPPSKLTEDFGKGPAPTVKGNNGGDNAAPPGLSGGPPAPSA